jgi:hypothetical protein
MSHKHHIIPRHAGGTDDPSNLIELSVDDHAKAHKTLYEQYGRWQDYVAWQGLAKLSPKEELVKIRQKEAGRKRIGEKNPAFGTVWCVEKSSKDVSSRKQFKKTDIPDNWISIAEWRDMHKNKNNNAYGRKWYNDGSKNLYLKPDDVIIEQLNLSKGRLIISNCCGFNK